MSLSLAEQWQRRLSQEPRADVDVFLKEHPDASTRDITDVLLVDQHAQWEAEPGPRIEEYLKRFPSLTEHPDCVLDLVYGEVRARRRLGFPASLEETVSRFPELEQPLSKQFELFEWVADEDSTGFLVESGAFRLMRHETSASEPSSEPADGETDFGDYRLIKCVGRGGMGVIYRARHDLLGREVAIKMLSAERLGSDADLQRFHNEVLAVARFDHPNIAPIYEVGNCDGTPFFTTKLVENGSLADNRERFANQPKRIAELLAATARAVHHAHQRGVLHRDVKPSNVLIDEQDQPLLTDFGLAQLLQNSSDLTRTGELVGTPVWLAPERAIPKPGPATTAIDVYGLGAILYFLLTGRAPFQGEGLLDTLVLVRDGSVAPPRHYDPAVSRDLEMVCLKAMERDPSRRYPTAEALADDLDRYVRGEAVLARPLPWHAYWRRWVKRHPVAATAIGMILLAAFLLAAMASFYTIQQSRLNRTLEQRTLEVEMSRQRAGRMEAEAAAIRDEAMATRRDHRERLYAAHIRQAGDALKVSDIRQVDDVLNRQIAEPDRADLRGFEWFWMRRQSSVGPPLHEVRLHNPRCLQYSPNGVWLAVGDSVGECWLLNAASMEVERSWKTAHPMVESVSFSPSSGLLSTAGNDSSIRVWDVHNDKLRHVLSVPEGESWQAQFIDDARLVAWCRSGTVMLLNVSEAGGRSDLVTNASGVWDVAVCEERQLLAVLGRYSVQVFHSGTLGELSTLPPSSGSPFGRRIRFCDSGQRFVFDDGTRQLMVYKVQEDGSLMLEQSIDFPDLVREFDVLPDGSRFVVGSHLGSVFVSSSAATAGPSPNTFELSAKWQAHKDRINGIAFSPSGAEVVTVSRDHLLRVWQPTTTPLTQTLMPETELEIYDSEIAAPASGESLAAAGANGIRFWDLHTGAFTTSIGSNGSGQSAVAVSRSGRLVAGAAPDDSAIIEVWDVAGRQTSSEPGHTAHPAAVLLWQREGQTCPYLEFSPDEKLLAIVDHQHDRVLIVNANDGNTLRELSVESVWQARFSPDGSHLAVSTLDSTTVFNCETWQPVHQLNGHVSTVTTLAYSPDGRHIATGGHDRSVRIFDADNGAELWRMLGHRDWIKDLAFAPDGRSLVSASRDGTIKVWQVSTGEFLCDLYTGGQNRPFRLTFCGQAGKLAVRLEDGNIIMLATERSE